MVAPLCNIPLGPRVARRRPELTRRCVRPRRLKLRRKGLFRSKKTFLYYRDSAVVRT